MSRYIRDIKGRVVSVGVIRSTGDLNRMYGVHYDERDLTEFEFEIFNSPGEPDVDIDFADVETLAALSIYYDPYIRPKENDKLLRVLDRLIDYGDNRGYLRLGAYYMKKR